MENLTQSGVTVETLTAHDLAEAYENGRLGNRAVTATLRNFHSDHAFLTSFASSVAEIRKVDSSAKLGDLATALKAATKPRDEDDKITRLTFSFNKRKAYFGQSAGFSITVIPYTPKTKDGGNDALAALAKVAAYLGEDADMDSAQAIITLLDRIEVTGTNAVNNKNGIREACRAIIG